MAAAFALLRWPPAVFWAATPRELAAALRGLTGGAARSSIDRSSLEALMRRFPDG